MTVGVLFVCTANICRSPMAEGAFRGMAERAGLGAAFEIASAGTSDVMAGQPATPVAVAVAAARGYDIATHSARQVTAEDVVHFDHVLAMTREHLADLRWLAPRALANKPKLLMSFGPPAGFLDVEDPYGLQKPDYERALSLIEVGCRGLLDRLTPQVKRAI